MADEGSLSACRHGRPVTTEGPSGRAASQVREEPQGEEACVFYEDFETPLLEVHRTSIDFGGEPAALCGEGADHIDLWYTGPGNRIHHARSLDGIAFESRPTDLPEGLLRSTVLEEGGLYYLYGAARDRSIHLYTSRDGVHFEAGGVALAGGQGRDRYVANSFVWVEDGLWHMLYEAGHDEGPSRWDICLATAATPTGFSSGRHPGNPVLVAPGGGCGNPELARIGSRVLRQGGRYWLLYHRGENWRAHSADLHSWTQEGVAWGYDRADPVGYSCGDASVCQFRGRTYIWKSVSDQVSRCWMSVAIADLPLREYLATRVPVSAARWEDPSPDGGYPRYPDMDTTLARTGRSSVFLKKPYWREPRGVAMGHRYRPDGPVVVSAWLHDGGPGPAGEAHVGLRDVAGAGEVRAGIDTAVSGACYMVTVDGRAVASPVARTRGWHEVAFAVQEGGTEISIDGACAGRDGAVGAGTMGWVTFGSRAVTPADVSLDTVTIRRLAVG
ncbi:MAG: hypothetical protein ABIL09_05325 [Gemmatimonadota bacterium]